jgi:hypothetical protein
MLTAYEMQYLLAAINLLVCSIVGWTALCRIYLMEARTTRWIFRLKYALLLGAATGSGFSPILFGDWPTVSQVLITATFAFVLAAGARAWHFGVPTYAQRQPAPRRADGRRFSDAAAPTR